MPTLSLAGDPFADLYPKDPAEDTASAAKEGPPDLIGGGTPDAPAYQVRNGRIENVPIGVAVSTTDYGPFSDLAATGPEMAPVNVTREQFGEFADLAPPDPVPETQQALDETPASAQAKLADTLTYPEGSPEQQRLSAIARGQQPDLRTNEQLQAEREQEKIKAANTAFPGAATVFKALQWPAYAAAEMSDLLGQKEQGSIIRGVADGIANTAAGVLTSPSGLVLAASGGLLSRLGKLGTVLLSSAFEAKAIEAAPEQWKEFKTALENGDTQGAADKGIQLLAGLGIPALIPLAHERAVRPAESPEAVAAAPTAEGVAAQPEAAPGLGEPTISQPTGGGEPNAVQEPSAATEIPRTAQAGENITQNGEGIRPGEQGQEIAGTSQTQAPASEIGVRSAASTEGAQMTSPLAEAWDKFDVTGEIQTVPDLVDEVENLIAEGKAPESLQEAVDNYREADRENFQELGGRGDSDAYEQEFTDAVQKAVSTEQPAEAKPRPAEGGGEIKPAAATPEELGALRAQESLREDLPMFNAKTPEGGEQPFSIGAASPEEFMRRYALVGASHLLEGKTDLASFSQAMVKEFGTQIGDRLPEIFDRAKQVVNEFQTATGKSDVARFINREIGITKARETPVLVRPLASLKASLAAQEKAGAAGYKRGFKEAYAQGKEAAAQIKRDLGMADRFMAGDQEQVRQNMIDYANAMLPPAERGRFIGAITRALRRPALGSDPGVMYRHAFQVMKLIGDRAEDVYRGNLVDEIRTTFDETLSSPTVDVAYRRKLKELFNSVSLTKPNKQTVARLQSLNAFVEKERAAGRESQISKDELDQLATLSRLPLKDMPTNTLEQFRDDVKNLAALGKLKAKLLERVWDRTKERLTEEFQTVPVSPIEDRSLYRAQPTKKLTFSQRFANAVRRSFNAKDNLGEAIAPMDEIYDHLDGANGTYDGWVSRNVKGRIDLAANKSLAEWLPIKEEADAISKKYGLTKADYEFIQVKAIIGMIGRERLEEMGVKPAILDRIDGTDFTPGQRTYHDFIRSTYDRVGGDIRDLAHRLYQIDMQVVDNYVPLQRDWAIYSEREAPEPLADPTIGQVPFNENATMRQLAHDLNPKAISRTEQGFLKDRIEGAKTAVRLNARDVFERHVRDALHFKHAQPELKMLGELVRGKDFPLKYGEAGRNIVLDHLDTVANQGYVNHMQRIRWIDWIRNSTSKAAVGFRVASNIVHASQVPYSSYHAGGTNWWAKGMQLALTKEGQAFLRKHAAETYVRSGGEPAQAEAEMISKIGKAGFFVARNIDKLNAQATFLGRYVKEMAKRGVKVDDALEVPVDPEVQALALRRMHRAVASPQAKDIPQMTSRAKSIGGNISVARAVNQFRNIFLDNYSNIRHDILRVGVKDAERIIQLFKDGEVKAGVKEATDSIALRSAMAFATLASIAIETGIKLYVRRGIQSGVAAVTGAQPKQKDDGKTEGEKFLAEFEHHLINRAPFVGQISNAIVYGDTGVPMVDALVKPLEETGIVLTSTHPETKAKHISRTVQAATTLAGIPGSSQLIEAAEPTTSKVLGSVLPDTTKHRGRQITIPGVHRPRLRKRGP